MRPRTFSPTIADHEGRGEDLSAGPASPASSPGGAEPEPWWRRWPRVAYECTAMLGGYLYFGGFGLLISVACWPLSLAFAGRPGMAHACQRLIQKGFAIFLAYIDAAGIVKVEFAPGVERLRDMRGTIIAPNHPCLLDAVFLISRLPRVTCIMKRAVLSNPALGGTARLAGYLSNDSGPNFIRRCRDALRRGDCLLIFPEGTRTRPENRPLNPFKNPGQRTRADGVHRNPLRLPRQTLAPPAQTDSAGAIPRQPRGTVRAGPRGGGKDAGR